MVNNVFELTNFEFKNLEGGSQLSKSGLVRMKTGTEAQQFATLNSLIISPTPDQNQKRDSISVKLDTGTYLSWLIINLN